MTLVKDSKEYFIQEELWFCIDQAQLQIQQGQVWIYSQGTGLGWIIVWKITEETLNLGGFLLDNSIES